MDDANLDSKLKNIILILQQSVRTQKEIKKLEEMTQDVPFFQQYRKDGKDFIHKRCCAFMGYEYFKQGDAIFHIDTHGDKFYIILQGNVGVYIKIDSNENANADSNNKEKINKDGKDKDANKQNENKVQLTCVKELGDGMSFGELSLLQNKKRLASIICHSNCHIAVLNKQQFMQVLGESEEQKILKEMQFFADLPFFDGWNFNLLKLLYLNSYVKSYTKGQFVFKENTDSNAVYFIKSGEFELQKDFQYLNVMQVGDSSPQESQSQTKQFNNTYSKFDQVINDKKHQKRKSIENQQGNKNFKGNNKDPLGRLIKLCIYTDKEMFGEEDILQGQKRSFSARCISFTGELIMIKLRDFQHRILNDIRTKQLIYQRLETKNEMMEKKIQLLEKSMYNFTDYYFPKSNVITSLNASNIPLFRKSHQNTKFKFSDRTYQYVENLPSSIPQTNFMSPQNTSSPTQKKLQDYQSLITQFTLKEQSSDNFNLQAPMTSSSGIIRSNTHIQINNFEFKSSKIQSQKLFKLKSSFLHKNDGVDETLSPLMPLPEYCKQNSNQGTGNLRHNKQPSICYGLLNNNTNLLNINKNNEYIFSNSPLTIKQQSPQDLAALNLSSPSKIKTSFIFKTQDPKDQMYQSQSSSNQASPTLKQNLKIEEISEYQDIPQTLTQKLIHSQEESENSTHRISEFNFDLNDSILTQRQRPKKYRSFEQQKEINDSSQNNNNSLHLKLQNSQMNNNTSQNSLQFQNDQQNKSNSMKKSPKNDNRRNEMTESFYKSLRINYLTKFKTQNIQNLKKHIQSSLIDKMPDQFEPLESSELKLYNKKKKGNYELEKDRFLKWFSHEMYENRQHNKIQNSVERKKKEEAKQKTNHNHENQELIISLTNDEVHNNHRIHSIDSNRKNPNQLRQKKFMRELFLNTEIDNDTPHTVLSSPIKKNSSFQILKSISQQRKQESNRQIDVPNLDEQKKTDIIENDNYNESAQSLKKSNSSKIIDSHSKMGNSIQFLYEQHLNKNEFGRSSSQKNIIHFSTERNNQNQNSERLDSSNSFMKVEKVETQSAMAGNASTNFAQQTKFDELKLLKKPKLLGGLQQYLNLNSQKQSCFNQIDSQKSPKISVPNTPLNKTQTLNQLLSDLKIPKNQKFLKLKKVNNQNYVDNSFSPISSQPIANKNNKSDSNIFKFFKKSTDRKVISKFEQELYQTNNRSHNII